MLYNSLPHVIKRHAMIIAQEQFFAILSTFSLSTLKMQMGRVRLKFTVEELARLLYLLNMAQTQKIMLKALWGDRPGGLGSYQNFCKNLDLVAKLMPLIFTKFNALHGVKPSALYNVIDTSLISTKMAKSIRSKDFKDGNVTVRKVDGQPHHIYGLKLFATINRRGMICKATALHINTPDIDATKNPYYYGLPKGILLADRGFNSALVRQRLSGCGTRLISPFKSNQKQQLNDKERKLYKKRWAIETVFQQLKAAYGAFKLGTSSKYTLIKQKAAIFLSILNYNASLI